MNGIFNLIHACFIVFLFHPGVQQNAGKDTLRIKTEGPGNHIKIDSAWFSHSPADTLRTAGASGEIKQTGKNNSVEINTTREVPNSKKQITNNNQKTNCKNQTKPAIRRQADRQETSNKQPVTIKQTGNNNSVKINQR